MKYEQVEGKCGNCGEVDDLCEIENAISYRIVKDNGTVLYVCLKCAATTFKIDEAVADRKLYGCGTKGKIWRREVKQ